MTLCNYTDGSKLNGKVISGGTSNVTIIVQKNGGDYQTYATSAGDGALINGIPSGQATRIVLSITSSVTCSNVVVKPMICTEDVYNASQTYQPYALSNVELTEDVTSLEKRACKSANTSSNTILELSATDIPASARGAYLLSIPFQGDTRAPTLYYILFIGEFLQAYELIGGTNPIVTAVTVKQSKIYFTCAAATWTPPVLLPLIREANAPTINMQWVSSIPT